MAVTNKVYTAACLGFAKGTYKWLTTSGSTFKMALVSSYSFNQDHDFWDDASASEVGESGDYATGGATLATTDASADTANNRVLFDTSAAVAWTGTTISATGAIIYQSTGTASTSSLICYIDFGETKSSVAGTFTVTPHADGWFSITATA
jgi:hypothetical protein